MSTITAINIAPGRRLPTKPVTSVVAEAGLGLVGDRYHGARHRHVTLQSAEQLALAAADLGRPVEPAGTRRNLTVDVGVVPTAPGTLVRIGSVLLEVVRVAAPCKLLEDNLGPGAAAALRRGRAGSCLRVLESGTIALGDLVDWRQPVLDERAVVSPTRRLVAYVLPVFEEVANLPVFHDALVTATEARPDLDFEFVYVDDGSRDGSLEQLLALRAADPRVSVLSLSRNCGHQIAVTAGLDAAAEADAVVVMDTDLQDPPEVSLEMLRMWEGGVDVVYAQRRSRRDSVFKRATAYGFYWLLDRIASVKTPRNVGDFRLMDRRVVAEVSKYREHDRFMRGIVAHVGFRQEALLYDRDARHAGTSGYSLRSLVGLAASGIIGFSTTPLKLISRLGIAISGFSVLLAAYVLYVRLFRPEDSVPGWAFLGVGMFMLGGLQLIMMGVIGSYLGRVYVETQNRPLYSLALVARGSGPTGPVSPTDPA